MQNTIISRIHSFLLLYLSGTNLARKLETQEVSQYLKASQNLLDQVQIYGIKFPTRLLLGLSDIRDHKFRHYFQDTLNPLWDCVNDTETITDSFLRCPRSHTPRKTVSSHSKDQLIQTFLYGNPSCNLSVNRLVLNPTN